MTPPLSAIDTLLMHYVAGRLSPLESFIVASHISLNSRAQIRVKAFEDCAGRMIDDESPTPVSDDCLNALLKKIDGCQPCTEKKTYQPPLHQTPLSIPVEIHHLIADYCTEEPKSWKKLGAGIETFALKVCTPRKGCRKKLSLMRIEAGRSTPEHHHHGREITLVLAGGYSDHFGHYTKGDISILDGHRHSHAPIADNTGCLCLVLTDAPLRFQNPLHRILNLFMRI